MKLRSVFAVSFLLLALFVNAQAQEEMHKRVAPAIATILVRGDAERFEPVGSGVFVRSDGVLLTAYDLVQGAREIRVRMANGEIYDRVELAASDERRNVAVLRIHVTETPFVVIGTIDDSVIGMHLTAFYQANRQNARVSGGVLSSIGLADEIAGAGSGFRVLKFTTPVMAEAAGGVLVDNYGRALGLIAPLPQAQTQSYALPLHHIIGLVRSVQSMSATTNAMAIIPTLQELNRAIPVRQSSTTPLEQMPQVAVPQRPTTALTPAGPGSAVVKETDPAKLLVASKTVYIVSYSNLFKSVQLLNELKKKNEFAVWNLTFVDEREVADLILLIEHVPLTWEFPFSIKHQRTGVVIAAGKIYAWGGGDGASLLASRVVERLTKLRASVKTETGNGK